MPPAALSKRQQARNERSLQDLIRSVPGNDRCADCQAPNPAWASWNLGVFLCMRCATLHRKLGTHVSKVKSLNMDTWSMDQVDVMKKNGNSAVNKIYNPRNVRPSIPIDVDEADSAMERFIRQKYELRTLEDGKPKPPSREDPSYTTTPGKPAQLRQHPQEHEKRSQYSPPPPLPPKPKSKFSFGFRSISGSDKAAKQRSSQKKTYVVENNHKPMKTFAGVEDETASSFESKLAVLRDMGYTDSKRNTAVLKGLNGDVDRAIDTLSRLRENSTPVSRSHSPAAASKASHDSGAARSVQTPPPTSTNPFDNLDSRSPSGNTFGISIKRPEPHSSQSAGGGSIQDRPIVRRHASYNPFDAMGTTATATSTPTAEIDRSFQNLQVSQPLFPNMTGGYPSQQQDINAIQPPARLQQSMTPPVATPVQYAARPLSTNGNYNPFLSQPVVHVSDNNVPQNNPFFGHMSPTQTLQSNAQLPPHPHQHANTMPATFASAPSPLINTQQPMHNPFFSQSSNTAAVQYGQYPQFQPVQQSLPQQQLQQHQHQVQQPPRIDKSGILALYNFSQPPPSIPEQSQAQPQPQHQQQDQHLLPSLQTDSITPSNEVSTMSAPAQSASRNPFFAPPSSSNNNPHSNSPYNNLPQQPTPANAGLIRTHMSQESIDIRQTQSGRHSPDVFASLSARYV